MLKGTAGPVVNPTLYPHWLRHCTAYSFTQKTSTCIFLILLLFKKGVVSARGWKGGVERTKRTRERESDALKNNDRVLVCRPFGGWRHRRSVLLPPRTDKKGHIPHSLPIASGVIYAPGSHFHARARRANRLSRNETQNKRRNFYWYYGVREGGGVFVVW